MFYYLFIVMVEHSVGSYVESKQNIVESFDEFKPFIVEASLELKLKIV